jgi:lipopolysaccharide export system protein LptA
MVVRHLTAAAIVVLLVITGVLLVQRVGKLKTPLSEIASDAISRNGGESAVGVYTGFEFVERVAGRLIFGLTSERTLGLSSGWHEIEGVRLQFYREGEPGPVLTCDGASFNIETRDAKLHGGIQIRMPSGALLTTEEARFEASSRKITTDSEVLFISGGLYGRSQRASFDLERNVIALQGGTTVRSAEGVTMTAPEAIYRRSKQVIEFPDGCVVRDQSSMVEAPFVSVKLTEADGPPYEVELDGGVTAHSRDLPGGGFVEAWMEKAVATSDGRGNWQIDGTTSGPWVTVRFVGGEGFFERTLRTWILRGVVNEGGILNLRAERGVCIHEVPVEGPPRRAESSSARVWFSDGQATDIELLRNVILEGEGFAGKAYRARLSPSAGLIMLHGDPTSPERVLLLSDRGRLSCDQAQFFNQEDRVEVRGNVQGEIADVSFMGSEEGKGGDPVRFACEVLEVTEKGEVFHLKENARVWQGHRLLLADDVVYRRDGTSLRASGHVRTTMPASELSLEGKPEEDVVVIARSLTYGREAKSAVYRGNVRYSDPGHTLSASELSVFFNDDNDVTAVEAVGSVEMVDLESGRRMTGQKARREVATRVVTITGSPVQVIEPGGNQVSGASLTWNQADGTVALSGGTETIYYNRGEAP